LFWGLYDRLCGRLYWMYWLSGNKWRWRMFRLYRMLYRLSRRVFWM
jgi:hypothetical protein